MNKILRHILKFFRKIIACAVEKSDIFRKITKDFLTNFYIWIKHICRELLLKVYSVKFRYVAVLYAVVFIIGRASALQKDFSRSVFHQMDLTIISFIVIHILQYLHKMLAEIREAMPDIDPEISLCFDKLDKARLSPVNFFVPIFPVIFFIQVSKEMAFVPLAGVGYFMIYFSASAFYISLIAYWQLLLSTRMIYSLTRVEYIKLPFRYPDDLLKVPRWLKNFADLYRRAQFSFFSVGMIFTMEFILLMPSDIDILDGRGGFNKLLPMGFWETWIIIFVFIIIAFPICWTILKRLLIKLTMNFNQRAVYGLEDVKSGSEPSDLTSIWSYYQLINHAVKFDKKLFIKHNYYPAVATAVSFILNVYKVFELLKFSLKL